MAASDPAMWRDILLANREALLERVAALPRRCSTRCSARSLRRRRPRRCES
ncbi:MAG: hypothetical protein MZW92_25360 [Comamonadaceae bacterium]|nr:hypothetical protein [Comamonadaceae bacterium]